MNWLKNLYGSSIVLVILLFLSGCGLVASQNSYKNTNMDFGTIQTVAVLPFQNLSSDDQAAERVRDTFMGMLLATEAFNVLPPGEVGRGISRAALRTPQTPTIEEVKAISNILKVEAVMTGVLREYATVRSGATEANLVSLSLQLIETQTGAIVWSASATKGGITLADRLLGGGGKPMNHVTEQVVNDLLDKLFD